ncbi:MAG: hypothetical protein M1539_04275 [Actinobacteria bacterium]|nr:hypothetical protein [Actinomycetota bacterium]MCL5883175.1 hypothetical protein [Actinomycetota bacterium]
MDDAAVYGTLNVIYQGNNKATIEPNDFDFDMKSDNDLTVGNIFRDAETLVGQAHAGVGTGYSIHFDGYTDIGGGCSIKDRF